MSGAKAEQVGGRQLGWLAGRRRAASLEAAVVSSGPATILITFITINVHSHCFFFHHEIPRTSFSRITKLMVARG